MAYFSGKRVSIGRHVSLLISNKRNWIRKVSRLLLNTRCRVATLRLTTAFKQPPQVNFLEGQRLKESEVVSAVLYWGTQRGYLPGLVNYLLAASLRLELKLYFAWFQDDSGPPIRPCSGPSQRHVPTSRPNHAP